MIDVVKMTILQLLPDYFISKTAKPVKVRGLHARVEIRGLVRPKVPTPKGVRFVFAVTDNDDYAIALFDREGRMYMSKEVIERMKPSDLLKVIRTRYEFLSEHAEEYLDKLTEEFNFEFSEKDKKRIVKKMRTRFNKVLKNIDGINRSMLKKYEKLISD